VLPSLTMVVTIAPAAPAPSVMVLTMVLPSETMVVTIPPAAPVIVLTMVLPSETMVVTIPPAAPPREPVAVKASVADRAEPEAEPEALLAAPAQYWRP